MRIRDLVGGEAFITNGSQKEDGELVTVYKKLKPPNEWLPLSKEMWKLPNAVSLIDGMPICFDEDIKVIKLSTSTI